MTISPHKNSQVLNRIAQKVGQEYGVTPLPSDFKKKGGYKRSCEITEQYGMYRQDYCGCEFSMERLKRKESEQRYFLIHRFFRIFSVRLYSVLGNYPFFF